MKQVTYWVTDDGKQFQDRDSALEYERRRELAADVEVGMVGMSAFALVDYLLERWCIVRRPDTEAQR